MWNTNVNGVVNVSQIVVEDMIARGRGGCIINVSSQVRHMTIILSNLFCMHFSNTAHFSWITLSELETVYFVGSTLFGSG